MTKKFKTSYNKPMKANQIQINCYFKHPKTLTLDCEAFIRQVLAIKELTEGLYDFNFISNTEIIAINKRYLQRDYATDIISFNLGDKKKPIGDIYISIDMAIENASYYKHSLEDEIKLLLVHGILHLLDYRDYTDAEKETMFAEQDRILRLIDHV